MKLTAHVLFAQDTFLGGPLETSNDGILDFVKILDSLCAIHDDIGSCAVWAEAPDLTGFSDVLNKREEKLLVKLFNTSGRFQENFFLEKKFRPVEQKLKPSCCEYGQN
jgi:hypothetical protein